MAQFSATSDIYFSWSRNIALGIKSTEVPKDPVNLVATCNRFGLIFVANGSELQCTTLTDVENEHSIDKILPDSTTHQFFTVPVGGIINGVFISADETTVAVCTEALFCHMFDTRAFFDKTPRAIGPYFSVRVATSPEVALKDFAFNPVIPDMFAVVTSDGKVTNYEVASANGQFTLKIHGSYSGVQCCSWSPKGKQLVVAKADGSLVQLKPNMVEAKAIPAPALEGLVNPKPKAIFWASSTVFVVAYWSNRLQVVVTLLNKNAPTTYIPFDEPCLQNLDGEEFSRTWFCHVPTWNLLLMVCRNSPDVALFGHNDNCTQWTFYDVEGERAAIPIVNKQHTYPTGICINFSSEKMVEKKNQPSKPPSPMILLTNTGGSLSPYYLINDSSKVKLNSPPEPRSTHGMRRMLNPLSTTPKSQAETPVGAPLSKSKVNLLKQFEQQEAEQSPQTKKTGSENEPPKAAAAPAFSFSTTFTPSKPNLVPAPAQSTPIAATTFLGDQPKTLVSALGTQSSFAKFSMHPPEPTEVQKASPIPASGPAPGQQIPQQMTRPMAPPASAPIRPTPVKVTPKLEAIPQAAEEDSLSQETLSKAFFNELDSLTKELGDLKMRSSKVLAMPIGEEKLVTEMRSETKELLKKMDDVRADLKTMKTDVHEAEKVLIDALACGTQLRTITAAKDSRISRMDPITQATLKQAQGLAQYLERQLINANNVLDDAYEKYKNEKNTRRRTPTMEMLCRTILSCDKTIEALREELNAVRNKVEGIKRMQSLRERKHEDLTSLADSLLVVGVDSKDASEAQKGFGKDHQSFEKIKLLKDYLASRPVTEVTPTKLSPHGESMIVSKLSTILEQSRIEVAAERDQPANTRGRILPHLDNLPRESLGGALGLRPQVEFSMATPMKPLQAVTSTPFPKPVFEPISPPADGPEKTANLAASSFLQFQNPAKPSPPVLAFPKASPDKTVLGFQPTAGSGSSPQTVPGSSAKPFSFSLQKTPEAQGTNQTKPKVTFSFEAPKSKDPVAESLLSKPSSEENRGISTSPGSFFAPATTTAKPPTSSTGTDFSFAVKKDASPSKDFFSPANLGFSLSKKGEALSGTPPKVDSAANQTVPVVGDKLPATKTVGEFSFNLGDKKQDGATKEPATTFKFSFGGKPADQGPAGETEKPLAAAPGSSPFKMGDTGTQFSLGKSPGLFGAATTNEDPKTPPQTVASVTSPGDKVGTTATSTFSFGLKKTDDKTAMKPPGAAEAERGTFNFSLAGTTAAPVAPKAVSESPQAVAETFPGHTAAPPEVIESPTVGSEDSSNVSEVSTENAAQPSTESFAVPESVPAKAPVATSPQISAVAEEPRDAQVPASVTSAAAPVSTTSSTTSFFAVNRPLNLTSPVSSSGTSASSEGGTSIFSKPASGSLFGKAPSGGLFGSTTTATFGQSSAFGTSPGTSLFGGSSTTTTTSFFGNTLSSTASTAASTVSPPAAKPFAAFGSPPTVTDSAAQPAATTPSTTATPLFGSPSTFGQPSVFGSQSSAFGATTTSAFGATTTSAFASTTAPAFAATTTSAFGSGIAFGSTTTTAPAFGQPSAFGAQTKPQTELFGKTMTSSSGSLFGQKSTFGASSTGTSLFGGNATSPTGGFMSGLGQAGTQTTKNVFGGGTFGQNQQTTNLFGSGGATAFGAQPTYGGAANMGGMAPKESPFAMGSPTAAKPTFGGAATFGGGSPGGFGSAPAFVSGPVFGSSSTFGTTSPTTAFGNVSNTPTFGSLAQNQPSFGSPPAGGTFGAAQPTQPGFPAAAATPPKSAAFTQYRG